MPDIGLFELLLIGVLLFVVVGPERMPEFFSQIGRWLRQGRGWMGQFRDELKRETAGIAAPLADARKQLQEGADSIAMTARDITASVQSMDAPEENGSDKAPSKPQDGE